MNRQIIVIDLEVHVRTLTALIHPANDRLLLFYTTSITRFLLFYHQSSLSSQVRLFTFTSIFFQLLLGESLFQATLK